jgi:hypothetical protein
MKSLNGKRLITSFFLANLFDIVITTVFLSQDGWRELNSLAQNKIVMGEFYELIILKTALTAVLIGGYALASTLNSRLAYPLEQAVRIGSIVVWSVQIWNTINVIASVSLIT